MSLLDHVGELRKRLLWSLIVLVISMIGGLFAAEPILDYLKSQPPANTIEWNAFSPWDPINIYMKFALIIGLSVSLPVILYHVWAFVKPGLRSIEQKATIKYIPFAVILFFSGLSFAYFVIFPMAFYFTSSVSKHLNLTETYGISQYFSFMFNILLPMALLFELPVVVMFLTKIRILNPKRLQKMRRLSYLVLVVISTLVTPPDLISDILVAVPLILLYEFSVLLSRMIYRKQLEQDRAWEAEYGEKEI